MSRSSIVYKVSHSLLPGLALAAAAGAQTFTTLVNFDGANGAAPQHMTLVQGADGNLWGTTGMGGSGASGTIFKITPAGSLTTVYSFGGADGANPYAGLVQGVNGVFYGTTSAGGANGLGVIFKITPGGVLSAPYSFDGTAGANPAAALVQSLGGYLFGTASLGGAGCAPPGCGAIFKITPAVAPSLAASFGPPPGGTNPWSALVQVPNGSFFGTTYAGGAYGYGTVFQLPPGGSLSTVHSFNAADGAGPYAGLAQAASGALYGTTYSGGANGYGTIFRITLSGALSTLHSFDTADGANPFAALVQATDGNFYGTTYNGGANGYGVIFRMTPAGSVTTLYSFDRTSGANPVGGLLQATDGNFYGTTNGGGSGGDGTVFKLSTGLGPFVKTLPASGKVGSAVKILGTNLSRAATVAFNGVPAAFTVVSPALLSTTVPGGATTGHVRVSMPGGTLSSNVVFRVTP